MVDRLLSGPLLDTADARLFHSTATSALGFFLSTGNLHAAGTAGNLGNHRSNDDDDGTNAKDDDRHAAGTAGNLGGHGNDTMSSSDDGGKFSSSSGSVEPF